MVYNPFGRTVVREIPSPQTLDDAAKTAVTGTQVDAKFAAQLIGKDIPIFVGGQALMGCRIIEGPFLREEDGAGLCDMIVSPAIAASPEATRQLTSIRLNGTESFTSGDGGATWAPPSGSAVFDDVEINVLYGTEDQTPLASSISRYGSRAVPYRSHICVELKNIPLDSFANTIPFVSVYVYESDFVTRNAALLKLAKYARFNEDECDFAVSGHDTFWVVAKQASFIEYAQSLQRTIGRNWNIVPGETLRIFENSSTVTPIALTRTDIVEDSTRFTIVDPLLLPAQRTLGFVDTGRDNDFNSVKAVRARFPVALTASESTESVDIPIGMEAIDAKAAVNRSLLIDDIGRDQVTCKVLPHMRGLQTGDIIALDVDDDIDFEHGRIVSIARNASDWTSEILAERIELSLLEEGPSITSNGGGSTASISVDEEDGVSVTTVEADNADDEDAFSIVGGVDAAFFTIDPDTGVLEFLSPPDYEDPQDDDADNDYVVIVKVTGNGLVDTQVITVTVANVLEAPGEIFGPNYIIML